MTVKTNLGLVAWVLNWVGQPYWYGTCCYKCSDSLLTRKKAQYPAHYTSARMSRYKADVKAGKKCADCIGLIKGYYWTRDDGKQVYALDGRPDQSANGAYSAAKVKGPVQTLPEIPGLILHSDGHVGVYIGGGYAIEARGFNYGIVKTKVSSRPWKHWFKSPYIDYIEGGASAPQNTGNGAVSQKRLLKYVPGSSLMRGNDVLLVQETLLSLGYKPGIADGILGAQTAAAIKVFQRANGLEVDGVVGSKTWAALEAKGKAAAPKNEGPGAETDKEQTGPDPAEGNGITDTDTDADDPRDSGSDAAPDEGLTLDFGTRVLRYVKGRVMMTGADIVAVQTRLVQLGFNPGKTDGIFGPATADAVKAFQKAAGIKADGAVGADTRKKLAE